jgi:ECF transporter S component (folate family)
MPKQKEKSGKASVSRRRHAILTRLAVCAMMTALSVVLCRLLGWSPAESMGRVEIGFLPVAIVGMLYGPLWSGVVYGTADLIGAAIFTGVNPWITLCKVAFGVLLGLGLYTKRKPRPWEFSLRSAVTLLVIGFFVDVLAMSWVFVVMGYAPDFGVAFVTRVINAAVNLPIRIAVLIPVGILLGKYLEKYRVLPQKRAKKTDSEGGCK